MTAGVATERVVISEARRDLEAQFQVNSEIAADDAASAQIIRGRVDATTLNSNLVQFGLPKCSSVSATVADTTSQSSTASSAVSLPTVLGASAGGLVFLLICSVGGYFLYGLHRQRQVHSAFVKAVRNAKAGDDASTNGHFPPDSEKASEKGYLGLRTLYQAEVVLAKGRRGCVVRAFRKNSSEKAPLAIKVLVPKDQSFDSDERRRLEREGKLLRLVASRGPRSAVQALDFGQEALPLSPAARQCVLVHHGGIGGNDAAR